jgi:hypothetical protein
MGAGEEELEGGVLVVRMKETIMIITIQEL